MTKQWTVRPTVPSLFSFGISLSSVNFSCFLFPPPPFFASIHQHLATRWSRRERSSSSLLLRWRTELFFRLLKYFSDLKTPRDKRLIPSLTQKYISATPFPFPSFVHILFFERSEVICVGMQSAQMKQKLRKMETDDDSNRRDREYESLMHYCDFSQWMSFSLLILGCNVYLSMINHWLAFFKIGSERIVLW